jgi:hypothetical protein
MANSIDHSNSLHRTYAPVDEVAVQNVDEARLPGGRKLRGSSAILVPGTGLCLPSLGEANHEDQDRPGARRGCSRSGCDARGRVQECLNRDRACFLVGEPGSGKSALAKQIAESYVAACGSPRQRWTTIPNSPSSAASISPIHLPTFWPLPRNRA